jgi:hypothetical protein
MWLRILLAGIAGGILAFFMGAVSHMVFQLQGRTMLNVPYETKLVEHLKGHALGPGLYMIPGVPAGAEGEQAKMNELNERYKAGPAGLLLIAPAGQDMMGPGTLGSELYSDVMAALVAAWMLSKFASTVGYFNRWMAVLLLAVFSWFSLTASYHIWYRFPLEFIRDEFYCAALEWGVAGLAIAAIVRPRAAGVSAPPQSK